ncbi:MAG: DNA-processing protein DprA [Candidatus Omnitrophica bacterium]|nr:DNA-processing protein DprA [Candidatus Omnitrophota bacterium]
MKTVEKKSPIKILNFADEEYPINLKYIFDPPASLNIKGSLLKEDSIAIAVVGSRRATYYGQHNAENLAFHLAAKGITIVSGLARGVDSAAHRGALKAGGRTIAVLGSGVDVIYPPENSKLAEDVARNGAVISEFPLGTPPFKQNFPRRNRIISGMSLGIVVIEAAKRSGALITANFALEQGREVFAIPGKIGSLTSQGTHSLIKDGAKLVESVEDIIEEIESLRIYQDVKKQEALPLPGLSEEEKQIYDNITKEPSYIDDIMEKVIFSHGKLLNCLLRLEHKGLIKELPGKQFIRT